ncbi:MAG: hypothetical protein E7617_04555 [Ruminococcaceae bacterium]|nr:hypothetical protein [Oscillospiraceae bacterium]
MKRKWSKAKIWEWYNARPWIRGCNFIGSDCANRLDQWQSYGREERMKVADRELELAASIGFNTIRIIADFDVWLQERESYMSVLEEYLTIAAKHGISVCYVLATEVMLPRGIDEPFVPKKLGEQQYALGYHQGRFPVPEDELAKKPYHYLSRDGLREKFVEMLTEIVTKYKDDERILFWDVYNEPGIALAREAIPILEKVFEVVRSCDPSQPVTADIWRSVSGGHAGTPEEERAIELSDFVNFHCYGNLAKTVITIDTLRKYGRPLVCTEWMNRINHNEVKDIYPIYFLEKIGCYCWGFVVGKTQTNEPWEMFWKHYYDPNKQVDYDFTKWQHDLYRPGARHPYDPKEIDLIKQFNELADKNAAEK